MEVRLFCRSARPLSAVLCLLSFLSLLPSLSASLSASPSSSPVPSPAASGRVVTHPAPVVRVATPLAVRVNGRLVETIDLPMPDHCLEGADARPYSAVLFEADACVEVEVSGPPMGHVRILPLSRGIRPDVLGPTKMRFRATPPFTVAVEPSGRHQALVVSANVPDDHPPKADDPGVVFIGPGSHRRAKPLRLTSGQTLYLAPGAYLESPVVGVGTNITICGRGILSGAAWPHFGGPGGPKDGHRLVYLSGKNITVRDVTLMCSYSWTLSVSGEDILVDNVKILNGRVLNDDGIDVCRARRVTVRDCFVRSQDDCIAVKYWCEDLLVENCALWTDVANVFRIGYECDGPAFAYRNLTFRGIDVLHQSIRKKPADEMWAENTFFIQCGNGQRFGDIRIDDVRFDSPEAGDIFLNLRTFMVSNSWQRHTQPGHFRGLTVRNVRPQMPLMPNTLGVRLASVDGDHRVEGVTFENVSGLGPLEVVGDVRDLNLPPASFRRRTTWTAARGALGAGVVTVEATPEAEPADGRWGTCGLRCAGTSGRWGLSFLRRPSGDHGFEFERTVGARRHAPIGRRLYSRTNGPWTLGRTHRLAIKVAADTVEAVVFDANGRELFAEAWLVEGAASPTLGTPSVYSFGGLKVRFGDLECDSAE